MARNDEGDGGGACEMRQDLLVENPTERRIEAGERDDGAVLGEIAHLGVRERRGREGGGQYWRTRRRFASARRVSPLRLKPSRAWRALRVRFAAVFLDLSRPKRAG